MVCLELVDRLDSKKEVAAILCSALLALRPFLTTNKKYNNQSSRAVHHYEINIRDSRLSRIILRHFLIDTPSRHCRANIFAMLANDMNEQEKEKLRISAFHLREKYANYGNLNDVQRSLKILGLPVNDIFKMKIKPLVGINLGSPLTDHVVHIIDAPGYVCNYKNSLPELLINTTNDYFLGIHNESTAEFLKKVEGDHWNSEKTLRFIYYFRVCHLQKDIVYALVFKYLFLSDLQCTILIFMENDGTWDNCTVYYQLYPDPASSLYSIIPFAAIYLFLFILGLAGNLLLIYVTLKNKILQVVKPHARPLNRRGAVSATLILWTLSFIVTLPYAFNMEMVDFNVSAYGVCGKFCTEHWTTAMGRRSYTMVVMFSQFALPFSVMAFCYAQIFLVLNKRAKNRDKIVLGNKIARYTKYFYCVQVKLRRMDERSIALTQPCSIREPSNQSIDRKINGKDDSNNIYTRDDGRLVRTYVVAP
uniref:G_PROTEIN_RECEP_F1_2 domain-containing protein n=1 Tax=Heterorhabditis bacteriophora TaxID=37862 RepID=A0A1I7XE64_HETBA